MDRTYCKLILWLALATTACGAPLVPNYFTTNPNPTISFESHCFIGLGDSLTTTNLSSLISYPSILQTNFGYNLLTNDAVGGFGSQRIVTNLMNATNYFPIATGLRTTIGICAGKNDINGIVYSQSNSAAAQALTAITNMIGISRYAGCDIVLITVPYSPTNATPYAQSDPARQIINSNLLSMTNYPGVAGIVSFDVVCPPATWTNANGTLNTAVTADGIHPTASVDTNLAAAVNAVILTSLTATNPMTVPNPNNSFVPSFIGSKSTVMNGNTLTPYGGGVDCSSGLYFNDGTLGAADMFSSYYGDTSLPIWGTGTYFKTCRDGTLSGGGIWGYTFEDSTQMHDIILDPYDGYLVINPINANTANFWGTNYYNNGLIIGSSYLGGNVLQSVFPGAYYISPRDYSNSSQGIFGHHFLNAAMTKDVLIDPNDNSIVLGATGSTGTLADRNGLSVNNGTIIDFGGMTQGDTAATVSSNRIYAENVTNIAGASGPLLAIITTNGQLTFDGQNLTVSNLNLTGPSWKISSTGPYIQLYPGGYQDWLFGIGYCYSPAGGDVTLGLPGHCYDIQYDTNIQNAMTVVNSNNFTSSMVVNATGVTNKGPVFAVAMVTAAASTFYITNSFGTCVGTNTALTGTFPITLSPNGCIHAASGLSGYLYYP